MRRLGVDLVQGPLIGGSFPLSELSERVGRGISRSDSGVPSRYSKESRSIEPHPRGGA